VQFKAAKLLAALAVAGLAQQALAAAPAPNALPTGGKVVAGSAAITQAGNTMNINQSSQRAVINWNSFDVGSQATVNFNQPNSQAATLNYVNSASKSMINGAVNANGQVIFVNNNGVVFGKGAEVNVGGMVATTMNTSAQEFMDGKAVQTYEGGTTGKVINKGHITGNNINSYIALMAPQVKNTGVITATMGGDNAIALVAGQKVTLKFSGSQFVSVSVDASVVNALISNKLLINAGNGQVIIGANAAQNLMGSLIKNTGTVSANGINTSGGKISLTADNIEQSGTVEANSVNSNGGQVNLAANNINLAGGSKTTATGATGGGNINVGVNVQNAASNIQAAVQNNQLASTVSVQANAIVDASATQNGNGGNISIWSQIKTLVAGSLLAKGGAQGGNGGFIETSSKGSVVLAATTQVDTSAPKGKTGTWTIDPVALIVDSTSASVISNALNTTSVTLDATGNSCAFGACTQSQTPLIQILADIYSGNTNTALNLIATGGQIDINANVTAGQVYAVAQAINVNGSINTNGGSNSNIYLAGAIINILGNINSNGSNSSSNNSNNTNSSNLNSVNTTTANNRRNSQNGLNADQNTYTSNGGLINILATGDITVGSSLNATSYISANGINGGTINIVSTAGKTTINGIVDSIGKGLNGVGNGGNIAIVGKSQTDIIAALISSEGLSQGGVINLGQVNNLGNGTILAPPATAPPALSNFVNSAVVAAVDSNNSITSSNINLDSQTGINAPNGNIVVFGDQISVNNSNLSAVNGTIAIGRPSYGQGAVASLVAVANSNLTANRVETSGTLLGTDGAVVHAVEWLLDPTNVTIGTTSTTGTLAGDLVNAGVTNIKASDIVSAVNLGQTVNVVYTGTMAQTGALGFSPATGVTGTLILNNLSGTMGAGAVGLSGGITNSGAGTVNLNVYSNSTITVSGGITSTAGMINVALQSANQLMTSIGTNNNININAAITTRGGYVVLDGTGGTINGLGTSNPSITRGADLATNGKGGGIILSASADIRTTTTGVVVSTTTTGGNFVAATSGGFNLNTSATTDIGGSINLSVKGGNTDTANAGYGYLMSAGTNYMHSTGNIYIDARTPWGVNTNFWLQAGSLSSYSGSVTILSKEGNSVGGYGPNYLQAPIYAYGPITINADAVGNVTAKATLSSTAAGTITSATGSVQITTTSAITGVYSVSLAGLITAPQVAITASNSTAGGLGAQVTGGVTITSGNYATVADALNITATVGTVGQAGGISVTTGAITNNSNGGNVSFITNGDLTATASVNFATANTTNHAQTITYDTRTGNATSQITTGSFTYNATGATQEVNYVEESNGSNLTIGNSAASSIALSGYILVDNTNSGALTPSTTPTATNMTTVAGVTAQGALTAGDYISLSGINNSSTVNAVALGATTLTVTSASTAAQVISVIGYHNSANIGNPGIASTGAVNVQSNGGSVLYKSNGSISQSGQITVAQNTTADSVISFDTTTGNKLATINAGTVVFNGTSTKHINYNNLTSGAQIVVNSALVVPGSITFDNTYLNGVQGGINVSNAWQYGTTTALGGIPITASLTANYGIYIRGVVGSASATTAATVDAVSISGATLTTTGTFTAGTDAINIVGIVPVFVAATTAGSNAIKISGAVAINNNSTLGNTNLIAYTGHYNDVVTITNASTAGAIEVSAIGTTANIITVAGTLFTQNSNAGVFIASSNNGNVTPPKIINNGTGPVVIEAGAYLAIGTVNTACSATDCGQITAINGNSITSASGNVYLYAGSPGTTAVSTTTPATLTFLNPSLGTLSFSNTLFGQAYAAGNIPATLIPLNTFAAINTANVAAGTGGTSWNTGSIVAGANTGPVIQFRIQPSVTANVSAETTKVYGTTDPLFTAGNINSVGSLDYQLNANFVKTAANPGYIANGVSGCASTAGCMSLTVNTLSFVLPLTDFINSIYAAPSAPRTGYGTLAGEQVNGSGPTTLNSGASVYTYNLSSQHGVLVSSGVTVNIGGVANSPTGLIITPAPLTITASAEGKNYGSTLTPAGTEFTTTNLKNGVTVDGVTLTDAISTVGLASSGFVSSAVAGTYPITPSAAVFSSGAASNYTISYATGTLTVNGISVYITAANDTKVYGSSITGGAITYNGSGVSTNPVSTAYTVTGLLAGNSISGLTLTSTGGISTTGVGTYSIIPSLATISGAGAGNYTVYYSNGTMTVTPKPITITANAVTTPVYGTSSTLSQTAYTVTGGLVTGDAITSVAINYGAGTSVPGTVNAGTYAGALVPSSASGTGGFNSTNYTISYAAGSLTVNPLNLTITANAQTGATYGTAYSLGSSAYTKSIATLPNGDALSGVTLQSGGVNLVPGTTNAGTYIITPSAATFSSGIAANYNISYATGNLTIAKANLTITPNAVSTTYNGTTLNNTTYSDAIANYSVAGYKNTDSSSNTPISLTGAMTFTSSGQSSVTNAATYTYAVGTLAGTSSNTNYNIVWANAPNNTYVINKALATVVATKPYDGAATFAASTLTITGVGSETLSASAGTGLANSANVVGVSSLVTSGYTLGNGTGLAANYILPSSTSSVTITPLTLTASISGAAQTKVYDTTSTANLTAGSCTSNPCTAGNGVTLSGSTATSGSYTISGFVAGEGAYITTATGNYINATSGLATPNVTLNAVAVTAGSQANAVKAVISPTNILALSNTTLSNYVLPSTAQSATNATITAAALGVAANGYSMFTGGTTPTAVTSVSVTAASPSAPANPSATSLSAQVTGLLGTDSVAVSLPLPAGFSSASGGSYTLTPSIVSGITAGNYTITPTTATLLVVGNRDLVISAGNATHVYGTVTAANLATSATPVVQYCAAVSGSCAGSVINLTVASTATPNIWSATSTTGGIYNFTISVATPGYSTGGFAKVGTYAATASNNQVIHVDTTTVVNTYYVPGTVAITPLTVTPVNNQVPSKVYDATTALTMTPLTTSGMALAGDVLSMTGTAAYNSKNAGTNVGYTISNLALGSADAANYVLSTNTLAGTNGTITPAPLTVAGLSANNKVYDTTNAATISSAGQALAGVLGGDAVSISSTGSYSGTFSQVDAANGLTVTPKTSTVGGLTVMTGVTLTGADSGNYYVAGPSTPLAANITPVPVSLTGTRVYNGTTAFSASSLTVAGIAGQTLVLGGSGTANSANVGVANTLSSTSGLTLANGTTGTIGLASNYTLVGASSTISITPAAITVSAADVTKTYDGTNSATSTPVVVSGTLYANASNSGNTDTLSGGTYAYTNPNVGIGNKTVTVTGVLANDGNSGANYTISYINNTTSTITAKSISVTALAQTKSYGTSDPTLTYTVAGLASTDSLLVMTGNLLRQGTTAPNVATSVTYEQVGTYPIAIGSLSAGSNYTISSFTPANLTITKYATNALTVTANAQTKVYGTNDPTLTYVTTGLPASLTADGLTWTDSASTAVTGSLIRAGMTAPGVAPNATPEAVGTYAITNTYATSPLVSTNYNISYVGANLTITAAPLMVSAANKTKSYATDDPALTFNNPVGLINATVDGVAIADTSSVLTGSLARAQAGTLAGEQVATSPYAITQGTLVVTGGNYNLAFTPGTLTITPYAGTISVTAVNNQKGYGSSDPALTYTVSGLANVTLTNGVVINDTLKPTSFFAGNVARAAGETMGTYAIGVGSLALNSGAGANYSWVPTNPATFTAATFTINPATLYVIVADNGKFVFQNDPTPLTTVVYSGFVNGDTSTTAAGLVAPTLTRVSAGNNTVGTYAITASGASATNYIIVYQYTQGVTSGNPTGTNSNFYVAGSNDLLISPAPATAVYGTANSNINLGKPVVQTCLSPCAAPTDIVTLNYTGTSNGTLSYADPAKGSGGVSFALSTNYDSTTPALRNVDAYTLTPSGISQISNSAGGNNYQSVFGLGSSLSITPAPITITTTNVTKVYDGTTAATSAMGASAINVATGTTSTGIYSDVISGGNFVYASPNVCSGTCIVSVSNAAISGTSVVNALPNYSITYVDNTTSTITQAALTITANAQTKMYGTNDPTLTYTVRGLAASDTVTSVMSGSLTRALSGSLAGEQVNTNPGYSILQGTLAANANYSTSYVSSALKITPRAIWTGPGAWPGPGPAPTPVTVTAVNQTKVYGSNDPSLAYTVTGLVSVTLANGVVINDTAASVFTGGLLRAGTSAPGVATGIASEQVGSYAIANNSGTAPLALNAGAQANYGLAANGFIYNAGTLTITPNSATINIVAANKTKSYATNDPALTYTVNATNGSLVNATVDGVLINDTAGTVTSGALTRAQYGTLAGEQVTTAGYAITQGSVVASANYASSTFTPATLTITPYATPLTITADAKTKSYATNDPSLTYAVAGLVSGVVVDGVAITDTAANTMSGSLLRAGTSAPGVATSALSENVGTYLIAQGTVAPNANYTATYTSANLTITPYATPLTVTANNQTMVYGSSGMPTLTYGVTGIVNGAVVDGVTLSNSAASVFTGNLSTTATAYNGTTASASNVGNYPIAVGTLGLNTGEGANYTFVAANNFNAGTLSVTPAPLTIAVADNGKFVFQTDAQVQASATQISPVAYSGFVNGDALGALKSGSTLTEPTVVRTSAGNGVAGSYAITASGASASNYSITYQYTQGVSASTPNGTNSNFIIAGPYDVLIEAKPTTVMYGTSSVTYTRPVVTYCTSCGSSASVVTLTGTNVGNNWTFADSLSVSGGITFTLGSSYSTAAVATRSVGDYPIAPSNVAPITNATGGTNYNNLYKVDSVLTVTPAPISITTANVTKPYDGLATTVGAAPITTAGTQTYFGDTLSGGTFTYTSASAGAGNKVVTPDLVAIQNGASNVASNYVVTYVNNTTSTITPAALTITANAQSKVYGTNDPLLNYVVTGLASTDTISSALTGGLLRTGTSAPNVATSLASENVGSYAIGQGSLVANSNYALTYIGANLTITPITTNVVVTANNNTKVYGVNDPTLTSTAPALLTGVVVDGLTINDTVSSVFTGNVLRAGTSAPGVATGLASEQVGSYAIAQGTLALPANSNYSSFSFVPATFTITPKPAGINVVADNKTKMYATNDPALTYTASLATGSALVNGTVDGIAITDTFSNIFTGAITRALVATLPGEQVGSYAITQGSLASPNYAGINYTPGVLTITPRGPWTGPGAWPGPGPAPQALTVVADNQTKSYATNDPTLSYTVTGLASVTLANGVVINDTAASALTGSVTRSLYGTVAGEQVNTTSGYAITQGTLTQNANYMPLVFTPAVLTITPYATPIVVTAAAKTKSYGTNDPSLTYTVTGLVNGVSVDGVTLIDTPSTALTGNLVRTGTTAPNVATSIASEQVGSYVINQGTVYASNYNITYNSANLTITPYATPLAVVANAQTKVYGTSDPSLTYSISALPNILNADGLTWTDTVANSITGGLIRAGTSAANVATSIASEQVGSYVINQGTLDAANYNLVYTPANLTITPAVVTVTANSATKSYGTSDPALTYTTSGILSGVVVDGVTINDSSAIMSGSLGRAGYGTVAGEQVGTYATTIGGVNAGANYSTLLIPSALTITPYAGTITITADNKTMVYGSSSLPSLTYTPTGIPSSFSVDGVTWSDAAGSVLTGLPTTSATAFNGTAGSASNVGTYAINPSAVALTAGAGANYRTPTYVNGTLTVTQAPLTIAVADNGKFVFQTDAEVQASATQISPVVYSGFVNGDALGSLKTGSTLTAPTVTRATGGIAGTYDITASGASASNYSISYLYTNARNTASTFTIAGPYDVLITAAPSSIVYGTSSVTYATPTVQYCTSCDGLSSVHSLTGTHSGNAWTFADSYSVAGGVTFTLASPYDASVAPQRNVGAYVVSATNIAPIVTTAGATNYNHLYAVDSALTVTPLAIVVTATNAAKVYDGTNGVSTATTVPAATLANPSTLPYGDLLSGGSFVYVDPNAGTGNKVVNVSGVSAVNSSADVSGNYTITYTPNTTSTITTATLTVTANNQSKMYGTNDPSLTYTVSGLANTDTATSVLSGALLRDGTTRSVGGVVTVNSASYENVGSYVIGQGTLVSNSNYSLVYNQGTLNITPRGPWMGPGPWPGPGPAPQGLVVTATANTKIYGTNDPSLAYTVAGLLDQVVDGLRITDTATTVFGSTNVLRAGTSAAGVALSLADEQVASYTINKGSLALQNSNYGSSFAYNSAQFTITPKVVTGASIVADNKTKMYGTNDPALTFTASAPAGTFVVATVDGIAINDSAANVFTGQLTRAQVNTLAGEQVTPAGYAITQGSVAGSGNYSGFTYTPGVLTITPRRAWNPVTDGPWIGPGPAPLPLTVTAVPATKMFGAADPAFAYTVTGLVSVTLANGVVIADTPANTFTGALSRISGENSGGIYAITQGSLLQNANYSSMVYVPSTLTIGLAPQTINNMAVVQQQVAQEFVQDRPTDRIKKGELIYVRDKDDLKQYMQAIEVPSSGAFKFPVPDQIIQDLINLSGENVPSTQQAGSYKLLLLPKGSRLVVTLPDGAALPAGIKYDAGSKNFTVPKLGEVTLPLSVKVTLMRGNKVLSQKIMVVTK